MIARLTSSVSFAVEREWLRAIFYMVLSAVCWSAIELAGEHLVSGVSPYQLVWTRYVFHLLFMIVVLGPRYKTTIIQTQRFKLQIARSLCMLTMPVCFILAAQQMPAHDVWSVYWFAPMMVLGISSWLLGEHAGSRHWMAAAFGLIGVLLVLQPDRGIFSLASLLALGMGLSFSLHLTLSRILRVEHPLANLFYTGFGVFVPLCLVVPFLWQPPSLTSLAGMAFIGVVGALGLFAFARSAELAPMPVVAGFAYTEVIFTMLFNAVLFHELPGRMMLLGGLVIAGVVGYLFIHELRTHEPR